MGKKNKNRGKGESVSLADLAKMSGPAASLGTAFGGAAKATKADAVNLDDFLDPDKKRQNALEEFKASDAAPSKQSKKTSQDEFPGLDDDKPAATVVADVKKAKATAPAEEHKKAASSIPDAQPEQQAE